MTSVAAMVGDSAVLVEEVDARETALRATRLAAALPRPGTSEGRQMRRWLVQVLVAERLVAAEAVARGLTGDDAPAEDELLPDVAARLEIGSVAASALADPIGRAVFAHVTAAVDVADAAVAEYHRRNPFRFGGRAPDVGGWRGRPRSASLDEAQAQIADHLCAVARRREFRRWLDVQRAQLVELRPDHEHPGDPRQPDNTHRH